MSQIHTECCMCRTSLSYDPDDDAEAEAEYARLFPDAARANVLRAVICDDCWSNIKPDKPVQGVE